MDRLGGAAAAARKSPATISSTNSFILTPTGQLSVQVGLAFQTALGFLPRQLRAVAEIDFAEILVALIGGLLGHERLFHLQTPERALAGTIS